MSQRPEGICTDYLGRCPVQGQKVTLYGTDRFCRKCYDRKRNSDIMANRATMPDISNPQPNSEENALQSARTKLFDIFHTLTATDEDINKFFEVFGHYFRPLQIILEREKTAIDVLYKHVPPIVEPQPQPQQASTDSTGSTEPKKSRLLSKQVGAADSKAAVG